MYLWRAVDDDGEVLDFLVQKRRNKHAALKVLKRLLRNTGIHPESIVRDELTSYRASMKTPHLQGCRQPGGMWENNLAAFIGSRLGTRSGTFFRAPVADRPPAESPAA